MLTYENYFVVTKRQCLLHLGAVQMEWGRAGTGEAEEGHTASYRHWLADPALVMWLKSQLELTETM